MILNFGSMKKEILTTAAKLSIPPRTSASRPFIHINKVKGNSV